MIGQTKKSRFWSGVPPWVFIGAVFILLPIFAFVTYQNIHRQKEAGVQLLLEKGAALIRSFEAGARTGMMGFQGRGFGRLQKLLTETAQQPDIVYLLVADSNGTIVAHDDPARINDTHATELNLKDISLSKDLRWRVVNDSEGRKIFEVFRRFAPTGGGMGMGHGHMRGAMGRGRGFRKGWGRGYMGGDREDMTSPPPLESDRNGFEYSASSPQIIFVGLDMTSIEEARIADTRHSVVMGIFLLMVGFAGIILLFITQSFRSTKVSLSRIKAFSDNLVEHMPIGLLAIDPQQKISVMNYVAGKTLSIAFDDAIEKDARQVLPAELWQLIDRMDAAGGIIEKEIECPLKNGAVIPLQFSATLLNDENGNFLGRVLLFKDLSEVRSLQKEIARNLRLATVGRLAAGVAHEIRNPLSSIKGFATYFKERYRNAPEDLHIANIMIQEVDRLNKVVGQLLEFARPVTISKKPQAIQTFIQNSLKLVERQAAEKNIRLQAEIPTGLKDVWIDPDKMNQVLLNLYLNAIESMDDGGGLSVSLTADTEKKEIEIQIADTGIGISEQDLAHIFDPYFTTKSSGTGLGLAIAHKILEGHNGGIKVDSKSGKGTTVTLFFPYQTGSQNDEKP